MGSLSSSVGEMKERGDRPSLFDSFGLIRIVAVWVANKGSIGNLFLRAGLTLS